MKKEKKNERMNEKKRREQIWKTVWWIPAAAGILCAVLLGRPSVQEAAVQRELAEEVLRFHVLANSDSAEDQEEKLRVRDAVLKEMKPILAGVDSKAAAKKQLERNLRRLEAAAEREAEPEDVRAEFVTDWFPQKTYGDCTFPEGEYEALRIKIGDAGGRNWWCVLYPSLCFTAAVTPVVPEDGKKMLQTSLTEDAYQFLLQPGKMKIRYRWLSFLEET